MRAVDPTKRSAPAGCTRVCAGCRRQGGRCQVVTPHGKWVAQNGTPCLECGCAGLAPAVSGPKCRVDEGLFD